MIDKTTLDVLQKKVSDRDTKVREVSGLDDFLTQTTGICTVRVDGRYTFQIPASVLTSYFTAKKAELQAEIATLDAEAEAAVADLGKKVKP